MSVAELELILRALTIPECWKPSLREQAAEIISRELCALQQQSIFTETTA